MNYLVETALLGHGLQSVWDNEILSSFPPDARLAWVENGEIRIGNIHEFIPSRSESKNWSRLDGMAVINKHYKNKNAFLTASGTMAVAREIHCPTVITAGIGGIGDIKAERLSYDLPALSEMGITLVAASPKDMLDIPATLSWLHDHGVRTYGYNTEFCNGYIFNLDDIKLYKKITDDDLRGFKKGCNLILNPIPPCKRLNDLSILQKGILTGKQAEDMGRHYHPAANGCFDSLSGGHSSRIQLEALVSNIDVAKRLS